MLSPEVLEKYKLYEASVQDAKQQVTLLDQVYREAFDAKAKILKEDFSGTCLISCEWVATGEDRKTYALDIDEEVIAAAHELHLNGLHDDVRKRIHVKKQNVMQPLRSSVDIAGAFNFSYFIFHQRQELLRYFQAAYDSLKSQGVFVLETAGGAGFVEAPFKEHRKIKHTFGKKRGKDWFRYTWHQKTFDPQSNEGSYAIHFKKATGERMQDAFTYDWRIWSIPEVRDALLEVGFRDVRVYWENEDADDSDEELSYSQRDVGDSEYDTYIVYVVGVKN